MNVYEEYKSIRVLNELEFIIKINVYRSGKVIIVTRYDVRNAVLSILTYYYYYIINYDA